MSSELAQERLRFLALATRDAASDWDVHHRCGVVQRVSPGILSATRDRHRGPGVVGAAGPPGGSFCGHGFPVCWPKPSAMSRFACASLCRGSSAKASRNAETASANRLCRAKAMPRLL